MFDAYFIIWFKQACDYYIFFIKHVFYDRMFFYNV